MGQRSLAINTVLPHDLVRLSDTGDLTPDGAPSWVRDALATPWVVARRSPAAAGFIAVGVRGERRALRHAMIISCEHIEETVRPEELLDRNAVRDTPVFRALNHLRPRIAGTGLRWGPTGSAGFELATGTPTVRDSSDLDLIVRVDRLCPQAICRLHVLDDEFTLSKVRIDCQVQLTAGAVSLGELLSSSPHVLLRSDTGARLISRDELVT